MSAGTTEQIEREVSLSFETVTVCEQALVYCEDVTEDNVEKYTDALAELTDAWNEATAAERGEA